MRTSLCFGICFAECLDGKYTEETKIEIYKLDILPHLLIALFICGSEI